MSMVFEMVSLDPTTLVIIKLAFLAIAGMVLYLYATSRVNAYVRKNNIPLEKARELNPSFSLKVLDEEKDGRLEIQAIFAGNRPSAVYFISGPPVMITVFGVRTKGVLSAVSTSLNVAVAPTGSAAESLAASVPMAAIAKPPAGTGPPRGRTAVTLPLPSSTTSLPSPGGVEVP